MHWVHPLRNETARATHGLDDRSSPASHSRLRIQANFFLGKAKQ